MNIKVLITRTGFRIVGQALRGDPGWGSRPSSAATKDSQGSAGLQSAAGERGAVPGVQVGRPAPSRPNRVSEEFLSWEPRCWLSVCLRVRVSREVPRALGENSDDLSCFLEANEVNRSDL